MATFYAAYFDASGQSDGYEVLTIGGAVAPLAKWKRFDRDWEAVLKRERVKQFHATDFASSRGEYEGWNGDKPRRSKFLFELGQVIRKNINKIFMVNIEIDAWNHINREYLLEEVFFNPYALCGYTAIRQVLQWAKGKRISLPRLKIIFEHGDDGWEGLRTLANRSGVEPIRRSKAVAVPCQAADMIAWKSRIAFTNALGRFNKVISAPSADFENFRGILDEWSSLEKVLLRPGTPGVYGREALIRTCNNSGILKRSEWHKVASALG